MAIHRVLRALACGGAFLLLSPPASPRDVAEAFPLRSESFPAPAGAEAGAPGLAKLDARPLVFEPNVGQFDRRVRFAARRRGEVVFLTDTGAVVTLARRLQEPASTLAAMQPVPRGADREARIERTALRFRFLGARRHPRFEAMEPLPGRSNYLLGNRPERWHTGVPHYAKVLVRDAYPGIDIAYYDHGAGLEYDLIVAPGSDPAQVRLAVEGADGMRLDAEGDLVLSTAIGEITQRRPVVYQGDRSSPLHVDGRYRLVERGHRKEVHFELGGYDPSRALVMDPVLDFSTFFGGGAGDSISGIALDAAGDIYIGGSTVSATASFPVTVGAFQTVKDDFFDAFVAKLEGDGSQLLYSTYLGGDFNDFGRALAVDANGQAVLGGETGSSNFPTSNPQQALTGGTCGTVTKLNANGNGLVFSTFLGGNQVTFVRDVATDASLATYVTGTSFFNTSFPTTAGAFQALPTGQNDAYVVKYAANGGRVYATLLGSGGESGNAIVVNGAGLAHVIGTKGSTGTSINGVPVARIGPGTQGVLVAKLNATGTGLAYLTSIGGTGGDEGADGALDANGNLYFTGRSFSSDLPSTPPTPGGTNVAILGALNPAGGALAMSAPDAAAGKAAAFPITWYGNATATSGSCSAVGASGVSIALDPSGTILTLLGNGCPAEKFPVVNPVDELDCTPNCASTAGSFLLQYKIATALSGPTSATPIAGGSGTTTFASKLVMAPTGAAVFAVNTTGSPPTKDAMDDSANGGEDGMVMVVLDKAPPEVFKSFEAPNPTNPGDLVVLAIRVRNPNLEQLTGVVVEDHLPPGLFVLSAGPDSTLSASPSGCNDILGLRVAEGSVSQISNRYDLRTAPNGLETGIQVDYPQRNTTLPVPFDCTVRFQVSVGDDFLYQNVTEAPTSTNAGAGTPAQADLATTAPVTFTWDGLGGTNKISEAANFTNNLPLAANADVVFPAGPTVTTVDYDLPSHTLGRLYATGSGYVIGGDTINTDRGVETRALATYNAQISLVDTATLITGAGATVTYNGGLDVAAGETGYLYTEETGTTVIDSPIIDSELVALGEGLLLLQENVLPSFGTLKVDGFVQVDGDYPMLFRVRDFGKLSGSGSVGILENDGTVRAGSPALPYESFNAGSYSSPANGSLLRFNAQAAGAFAPLGSDSKAVAAGISSKLMVAGGATVGGLLQLDFDALPSVGATYTVISAGSLSGRFVGWGATPAPVFGDVSYTPTSVSFTVTSTSGIFRNGFE